LIKRKIDNGQKVEWIVLGVIILVATTSFTFVYDLWHTSFCSFAYLNGHFKDFYDWNVNVAGSGTIVYYPTIYILFAIWNIPLRLSGITGFGYNDQFVLLWQKTFCLMFLVITFILLYKLAKIVLADKVKAQHSVFILLTVPIFFMYEFSWALYDTVYCAFLLGGIICLLKNKDIGGIVCLAVALTLKTYTVFVIFPVLFYKYKKVWKLVAAVIGTASLYIVETILYSGSEYFTTEVLAPLDGGFMFVAFWGAQINNISLLLFVFMTCCMVAYRCEDEPKKLIFILTVSATTLPVLAQVTPNWLIMMLPFYVILIADRDKKDRQFFYLLNAVLSIGFIGYILTTRNSFYGEACVGAGIFGDALFGRADAYDYVTSIATDTFTHKLFNSYDTSVYGTVNPNTKYFTSVIAATICYAMWILYPRKKSEQFTLETNGIRTSERLFSYGCLFAALSVYYIPVIAWTIQNQVLFS